MLTPRRLAFILDALVFFVFVYSRMLTLAIAWTVVSFFFVFPILSFLAELVLPESQPTPPLDVARDLMPPRRYIDTYEYSDETFPRFTADPCPRCGSPLPAGEVVHCVGCHAMVIGKIAPQQSCEQPKDVEQDDRDQSPSPLIGYRKPPPIYG